MSGEQEKFVPRVSWRFGEPLVRVPPSQYTFTVRVGWKRGIANRLIYDELGVRFACVRGANGSQIEEYKDAPLQ